VNVSKKELTFQVEPGKECVETIVLESQVKGESVLFKVKTTEPGRYYVRPYVGLIRARQTAKIELIFNAMTELPPGLEKLSDRFLVQVARVPAGSGATAGDTDPDPSSIDAALKFWKDVKSSDVLSEKLKVKLIPKNAASSKSGAATTNAARSAAASNSVGAQTAAAPTVGTPRKEEKVMTVNEALGEDPIARRKALDEISELKKQLEEINEDLVAQEATLAELKNRAVGDKKDGVRLPTNEVKVEGPEVKIPIEQVVLMFVAALFSIALFIPSAGEVW